MAEDYEQQYKAVEKSYYFDRLNNIMLLIPTENDDRPKEKKENRHTHTKDVIRISEKLTSILGGNKDLVRVIAISHDLGHLPYAHYGERIMGKYSRGLRLKHEENGPLLYQEIVGKENAKQRVINGIREHRFLDKPHSSKESCIVNYADEIASFISNIRDGLYLGSCFNYKKFRKQAVQVLGVFPNDLKDLEDLLVQKADLNRPEKLLELLKLGESHWNRFRKHWRVKAKNLNIEQRILNYYNLVMSEAFGTGYYTQDFVNRKLLTERESGMKNFEDYKTGKDYIQKN